VKVLSVLSSAEDFTAINCQGELYLQDEIDIDESFSSPRVFNLDGKNDIWVATNPNTTYYWRVHVSDGINQTEDDSPFVFEIIPN
jgi:hypothetical protein